MTAPSAAFRRNIHQVAGDSQNRGPAFYGQSLAVMLANSTPYTGGQLATISTDDANFVPNNQVAATNTTVRSHHLFRYDGLVAVSALSFLTRFRHMVGAAQENHQVRMYIWNATSSAWEHLATSTGQGAPRTFSGGPVGPNFADYINGSGELYILHWDWEGMYRSGGCVHGDTLLTLEDGNQIAARDVEFGDLVFGRQDGERVARKVDECTYHHPDDWEMVEVRISGDLWYRVTANHMCPVGAGDDQKQAGELVVGELIPDSLGNLHPIAELQCTVENCDVVDLDVWCDNYEVNGVGGLLVRTMPDG